MFNILADLFAFHIIPLLVQNELMTLVSGKILNLHVDMQAFYIKTNIFK